MKDVMNQYGYLIAGAVVAISCLTLLIFLFLSPTGIMPDFIMRFVGVYF